MKKKGFTLVELLMYVALFACIAHLLFTFVVQATQAWLARAKVATHHVQTLLACDLLLRDIRQAPSSGTLWKKISAHECIWKSKNKNYDIGWLVSDDKLVRSTGHYDVPTQAWRSKKKRFALQGVTELTMQVMQQSGRIYAVHYALTIQKEEAYAVQQWVTVRERVL